MFNISAVVLAAGLSSRMNDYKPLMTYKNKSVAEVLMDKIVVCNFKEILVITGFNVHLLSEKLEKYSCKLIYNENFQSGMHSSVICGVENLDSTVDGFMLFLADQPQITSKLIMDLLNAFNTTNKGIIIPSYSGRTGHPIIIKNKYFHLVSKIDSNGGLKPFMRTFRDDIFYLNVDDEGVLFDIDTPDDYGRLIKDY